MDISEFQCPICGCDISSEASKTILVADNGRDASELYDYDEKRRK